MWSKKTFLYLQRNVFFMAKAKKSNNLPIFLFIGIVLLGSLVLWSMFDISDETNTVVDKTEEVTEELDTESVGEETGSDAEDAIISEQVEETTEDEVEEESTIEEIDVTGETEETLESSEDEVDISDEAKEILETRITAVASRTDQLLIELEKFEIDLKNTTLELTVEDNESMLESHIEYTNDIETTIDGYLSELATLDSEINTLTEETVDEFIIELNTISSSITSLHNDIRISMSDSYTNLHLTATHEDDFDDESDFLVSSVLLDFIYDDNEDIIISITFENVGTKESKESFTYYSTFTINGDEIDTCRGQVEQIDAGDSTTLFCEIRIKNNAYDYYGSLKDPEDSLELEIIGSIDSNLELDELSEINNELNWVMDLTVVDFNE